MNQLQNNKEWNKQRTGRVTASRVAGILGHSSFSNRDDVMREMVRQQFGMEPEISPYVQEILDYGTRHEDEAIEAVEEELGAAIVSIGFVEHPNYTWFGCSPDGFADAFGIEVKVPWARELSGAVNDAGYRDQCLFSLNCCPDAFGWHLFAYDPESEYLLSRPPFMRDEAHDWWVQHAKTLMEFVEEFEEIINHPNKRKPYLEPKVIERDDDAWVILAQEAVRLKSELDATSAELNSVKAQLEELAGGRPSKGHGVSVYSQTRQNTDYKSMIKDYGIDVSRYKYDPVTTWNVRISTK